MANTSAWSPFRVPVFRMLWFANVFSMVGTWVHDVGAGWLMTTLAPSPLMVSLVQTAGTLPMFFLALPAGALADIIDRRKLMIAAEVWMCLMVSVLGFITYKDTIQPTDLLILTFLLGVGVAIATPPWQAITPELVSKEDLAPALALNSVGINISRTIGPALGGLIIASFGIHWAFLFNGFSFFAVAVVLYFWNRQVKETSLPTEKFVSAMRLGWRFTKNSPDLKSVMLRTGAFIFPAGAMWCLLPLVVKQNLNGDSSDYGFLLTCLGVGAVLGAVFLPNLKKRYSIDILVGVSIAILSITMSLLGAAPNYSLVCGAMFVGGAAWLTVLSSFNVTAQTVIPSWVRARAMAIYFMLVFFGGYASGSLLWGALANKIGIPSTLYLASGVLITGLALTHRHRLGVRDSLNLSPSLHWPAPTVAIDMEHDDGPVLVTVEYEIDPKDFEAFKTSMQEMRLGRLRDGAMHWGLFQDAEYPGRIVENFLVESWAEHLRQHDRVTETDKAVQEKAWSFHIGKSSPKVSHQVNVL
jgi:MFS family permease